MNIFVTGGSGFIGSYVIEELLHRGHTVSSTDYNPDGFKFDGVTYHHADIMDGASIAKVISHAKPDVTIHLAGILGTTETWNHVHETVDSNIHGALNVYDACVAVKSDILTVDVGSRWLVPYTISKRAGAEFAFAYGMKHKVKAGVLRIFNVYGPRQSTKIIKIVPKFIECALKNLPLPVMGDKYADLVHARDVAKAFADSAENMDRINQVDGVLIGSGVNVKVKDVAEKIIKIVGKGTINQTPTRVGEEKSDAGFMNDDSALRLLDWKPSVNIDDGLTETIKWYMDKHPEWK
jgi:UDP-glucose 4-epimerase